MILDEATSNLDTLTEASIQHTIAHLGQEITCILIAHRLTTVQHCDRIYVLEQGELVQAGTHEQLMRADGNYKAFWNAP